MEEIPVGNAIARARHRKKLTQGELAELLGVTKSSVTAWESGKHFPRRHLGLVEEILEIDLGGYGLERAS